MRILVIAPHPDDEAIGCGGTIHKYMRIPGNYVHVLFLTSGENGCPKLSQHETRLIREQEAEDCRKTLDYNEYTFWSYPDGDFQDCEESRAKLLELVTRLEIDIIYGPHRGEQHNDHVQAAWMLHNIDFPSKRAYEISSPLSSFIHLVDITQEATIKRGAIKAYKSQVANNNYDEGILALNHYRGLLHGPNMMYAEVFA